MRFLVLCSLSIANSEELSGEHIRGWSEAETTADHW